jgi:hypothetical protein
MTKKLNIAILIALASASPVIAQESPMPSSSTPEATASVSPARNVRISFVPPPLEGTITLGIYDGNGKLVRVLHQEAELNEFTIGPDALVTQWDGRDDAGEDLPAGKYHARGYLVGRFKVEDLGPVAVPPVENKPANAKMKVMPNPLANDTRAVVDLGVGFDSDGSYLKTIDELPLFTVSETPNLTRAFITKKSEKSVDIWQVDGAAVHQFRISNVDKMMAFDCGEFDLK